MRKLSLRFSVCAFILIIFLCILNVACKEENRQSNAIVAPISSLTANDTIAYWDTVPRELVEPQVLDRDLSGFPGTNEISCLFMIFNALQVDYDVDEFCDVYFGAYDIGENDTQGEYSPEMLWGVSNLYFEEIDNNYKCENLYGQNIDLYKIAQNHYPMMVWYDSTFEGSNLPYTWHFIDPIVVYDGVDNNFICKTIYDEIVTIPIDEFYSTLERCGGYILVFGNYS